MKIPELEAKAEKLRQRIAQLKDDDEKLYGMWRTAMNKNNIMGANRICDAQRHIAHQLDEIGLQLDLVNDAIEVVSEL